MPRGLNVSRLVIADMFLFVSISNFFEWRNVHIMTFREARWATLDDSHVF